MATAAEAALAKGPLAAALAVGVDALARDQIITFTKYVRLVLPLDGYVFWVKADLVSESALLNTSRLNSFPLNAAPRVIDPAPTLDAKGSLHQVTDTRQDETETYAVNKLIFTSEVEVSDLNEVNPAMLWLATYGGVRFAFSSRRSFYRQADLYHYVGDAVYSDMAPQIIDSLAGFDTRNVVVSNSLPLWLALNGYAPAYAAFGNRVPLYPSFLLPNNLAPPFAAVHIPPGQTNALQATPSFDATLGHYQLVTEPVKITLYGLRNFSALDFLDCVNEYSLNTDNFGVMNMPVIRDEKRTQTELNAIGMKKSIEFTISYYQTTARNIARQLILNAIPTYYIGEQVAA